MQLADQPAVADLDRYHHAQHRHVHDNIKADRYAATLIRKLRLEVPLAHGPVRAVKIKDADRTRRNLDVMVF